MDRGNTGKSTARMQMNVRSNICERYVVSAANGGIDRKEARTPLSELARASLDGD